MSSTIATCRIDCRTSAEVSDLKIGVLKEIMENEASWDEDDLKAVKLLK